MVVEVGLVVQVVIVIIDAAASAVVVSCRRFHGGCHGIRSAPAAINDQVHKSPLPPPRPRLVVSLEVHFNSNRDAAAAAAADELPPTVRTSA